MRYGEVKGVGKPVSRLVLGTMIINRRERDKSFALLDDAFALGCTTLDCALVYAGGDSERCIGEWMRERGNRGRVVILTKGAHPNSDRQRVTPFDIASDLHDSLARLKTDYIDIYLLHRDDPSVPVGPIVEALNEHRRAGRIRAFGGSNWRHERIQEANDYAKAQGFEPFAASSPHFSLAEQVENPWGSGCVGISGPKEADAREWHIRTKTPLFAYSSLARGLFSGRITRANFEAIRDKIDGACLRAYCHECNLARLDRAYDLAGRKGATVAQIAMAYVLNHPMNVFACVGAESREEFRLNVEAGAISLSNDEMKWLEDG
ncbi:MAG TPA: aldo/keto reductase [Candidatus Brocadiia bacterium]|nr:aldo/keto reductase [Candidatus Brocadiia bacterium]